jgi:uncharacterized RDD family membrane protein YckC
MSDIGSQNPYAPPRAAVADRQAEQGSGIVLATRSSRFLAILVDSLPGFAIGIVGVIAVFATLGLSGIQAHEEFPTAVIVVLSLCGLAFVAFAIWNIYLVYNFGQTFGKRVMGIRVVRTDGSRASFARIFFLRWGAVALCSVVPIVGGLVSLIDPLLIFRDSQQCLHDTFADTNVATAESTPDATLAGSRG